MANKNDEDWNFEIVKFIAFDAYDLFEITTVNLGSFTGTLNIYDLNGKLTGIKAFEEGKEVSDIDKVHLAGNSYKYAPPIGPDDCLGCDWVAIQTERWKDYWIVASDAAGNLTSITYMGSYHQSTTTEWIYVPNQDSYNPGYGDYMGGNTYHDHYNDPHGPMATENPHDYEEELDEEPFRIINELENPCAYTVFYQLENGIYSNDPLKPEIEVPLNPFYSSMEDLNSIPLNLTEEILILFNSSSKFDYTIVNGQIPQGNASTKGSTTTISNSYLSAATRLSVARTMIHELVHAYLNVKYSNPIDLNSLDFRMLMDKYAKETGYVVGTNQYHHNFMGRYFAAMAYSLKEWDTTYGTGGGLGWDYYFSMAFTGQFTVDQNGNILTETETFKKMVPDSSDRKAIVKTILDEMKGNSDSKGDKC